MNVAVGSTTASTFRSVEYAHASPITSAELVALRVVAKSIGTNTLTNHPSVILVVATESSPVKPAALAQPLSADFEISGAIDTIHRTATHALPAGRAQLRELPRTAPAPVAQADRMSNTLPRQLIRTPPSQNLKAFQASRLRPFALRPNLSHQRQLQLPCPIQVRCDDHQTKSDSPSVAE